MAKTYVASGRLEKGVVHLRKKREMDGVLKSWKDCEITVTIEKAHATRSLAQNALYWGVYIETMSEATGYSPNESHEILKAYCLPQELAERGENGRIINGLIIGGSTTKLDKLQFGDYLKECARWIAEQLGAVVPACSSEAA